MSYILTLVGSSVPLSIAHLEALAKFIEESGLGINGEPRWLDLHKAAEQPVDHHVTLQQMKRLRDIFAADFIDILCSKKDSRLKKLILCDMDATIVTTETLDELAAKAGIGAKVSAITKRAMNGDLDFNAALKERVALLRNMPISALQQTLLETEISEGAEKLISVMRLSGATSVLVSGGFTFFTGAIAEKVGFDHHHGNVLHLNGNTITGRVGEPILDKNGKLGFLKDYASKLGIELSETMAIGDGANDLPMLLAAGLGIGYRPKPILEENLVNVLKYADLSGALYTQGFANIC